MAAAADTTVDPADLRFGRIGFAVLTALATVTTIGAFTTLDFGTPARPAPGFWIGCVSVATLMLVVVALVNPRIAVDGVSRITRADAAAVALAVPLLALTPSLLTLLGLTVTTALVCLYWFLVITRTRPLFSVIGAGAITAGIVIIFIELLHVPFPLGTLTGIR
ncbi:tripartite tricarboxylate transporter TctB family protein [Haloactinopolyspora sp.]|uniref:tripartite tricarboxylate transporter TctB family protein n=1 Tax=Haloactinopolyspora sp. TaxID=1966353 RepID=UPI00261444B1|nr:tripartite tricarboxylate transporter TctB family protein [Haloactinopolyspora sp.]